MIELIKSIILWILVLTSIILTWQIWAYQPEYDVIRTDVEYFESIEIGEEKSTRDVLIPDHITIHEEGDVYWLNPSQDSYDNIMEEIADLSIPFLRTGDSRRVPSMNRDYDGRNIELSFNDPVQGDWLTRLFDFEEEQFPLDTVDRIILFENEESSDTEVSVRFISLSEADNVQADTNLPLSQLLSFYENDRDRLVPAKKHLFNEDDDHHYQDVKYVPNEEFHLNSYTYLSTKLEERDFIGALFSDPQFVKNYPQDNDTIYTDGNRMMSIVGNGLILDYAHPSTGVNQQEDVTEQSILRASLNFINAHKGWTDNYVIDSWNETSINDSIRFRLQIQGLPILGSNINRDGFYTMEITRVGNQVTEYKRSLFQLNENEEDFEIETNTEMPSFDDVWSFIEESENIHEDLVEDMKIGHYMNRQGALIYLTPSWFIKERGSWKQVDMHAEVLQDAPNREVD
ncbi:YycH family regulatory protein [Evansella halocellulosilytica]|uniref:YycH family regulatory protein n=1 Tax=Evansella halocellulosilytica TaxID=2011013 RepID=UPI000BB6F078|nr:two-component system activity regulator YycH [Evansella halocellulosilytica]